MPPESAAILPLLAAETSAAPRAENPACGCGQSVNVGSRSGSQKRAHSSHCGNPDAASAGCAAGSPCTGRTAAPTTAQTAGACLVAPALADRPKNFLSAH